ncbi:hypothetical protein [Phenylobacterium sp.]|uniref:hypothetical protein n=1 Tax=Phenylobacterium sp. TaxID=1871053 RepID=UPI001220B227|nr:hypothetical protein [Phenylobacterium sp.]THD59273.1 MAG: hypothetical protein E8A49_16825 [Phenylobacterium sp.]
MARYLPGKDKYVAFAAIAEGGQVFVVFDPIDSHGHIRRRAVRLGPAVTLRHAESMAADFNAGIDWPFRVNLGELLLGSEIPHLQRAPEA